MTDRDNAAQADGDGQSVPPELAALLGPRGGDAPPSTGPSWVDFEPKLGRESGALDRVRSRPSGQRIALAAVLVAVWVGTVLLFTRRADLSVFPKGRMALDLVLMSAPLFVSILVALRPVYKRALPRWVRPAVVVAAAVGMVILVSLPIAHQAHPASLVGVGDDLAKRAVGCFGFGSIFGALTVVGLRALCRGVGRLWVPSLVVGAGAALAGSLALYLHCPITHPLHLWLGHVTVLVPLLGVALTVGRNHGEG